MRKYLKYLLLFIMCFSLFNINANAEDLEPGLYCTDGTFVPWEDSGINKEMIEGTYTNQSYKSDTTSPSYIILNTYPTTTKIIFPDNITNIGAYSFYNCTGLVDVIIPEGITTINDRAFANCTNLTNVSLPSTTTTLGAGAFTNCTSLVNINTENITSVSGYLFQGCTSLTSVGPVGSGSTIELNSSITSIQQSMFKGCTGLTDVYLDKNIKDVDYYGFQNCTNMKNLTLGSVCCYTGAFYGVSNLETITYIGSTIYKCSTASSGVYSYANFPQYTSRKNNPKITITNSVKNINEYAFYNCDFDSILEVPSSVTSISTSAFKGVKCVSYSGTATYKDTDTYWGATNLIGRAGAEATDITLNSASINLFASSNVTELTIMSPMVVDGVTYNITSIGAGTFSNFTSLVKLTVMESDIAIADDIGLNSNCEVHCYAGSTMDTYATGKGLTVVYLKDDPKTSVSGSIEATVIDIIVPLNVACYIDPNDNGFVASDITIINNTRCPISLSMSKFVIVDSVFANNILPDGLPDGLTWENLNSEQSKQYFALSLTAKDPNEWNTLTRIDPIYMVGDIEEQIDLGILDYRDSVSFKLNAWHGRSFKEVINISYQIVFITELV